LFRKTDAHATAKKTVRLEAIRKMRSAGLDMLMVRVRLKNGCSRISKADDVLALSRRGETPLKRR
jgi:hypothetical protein